MNADKICTMRCKLAEWREEVAGGRQTGRQGRKKEGAHTPDVDCIGQAQAVNELLLVDVAAILQQVDCR